MKESDARAIISIDCQDVIAKAYESAGKLIAQAVAENKDNYSRIFEDARAIVNALVMEMTFIRRG